jgi:hypothetical protein
LVKMFMDTCSGIFLTARGLQLLQEDQPECLFASIAWAGNFSAGYTL